MQRLITNINMISILERELLVKAQFMVTMIVIIAFIAIIVRITGIIILMMANLSREINALSFQSIIWIIIFSSH